MMRAGKLDREVMIERSTTTLDSAGTPLMTWATLATLRAQLIDDVTDEKRRDLGASTERTVTFKTRHFPGVTVADRLTYDGEPFNLLHIKEIGRRRGLELRAERIGP